MSDLPRVTWRLSLLSALMTLAALSGCLDGSEESELSGEGRPDDYAEVPVRDCDGKKIPRNEPLFGFKGNWLTVSETEHFIRIESVGTYMVNWSNMQAYAELPGVRIAFNSTATQANSVALPTNSENAIQIEEAFGEKFIKNCQSLHYCATVELPAETKVYLTSPPWDERWGRQTLSTFWDDGIPAC